MNKFKYLQGEFIKSDSFVIDNELGHILTINAISPVFEPNELRFERPSVESKVGSILIEMGRVFFTITVVVVMGVIISMSVLGIYSLCKDIFFKFA